MGRISEALSTYYYVIKWEANATPSFDWDLVHDKDPFTEQAPHYVSDNLKLPYPKKVGGLNQSFS